MASLAKLPAELLDHIVSYFDSQSGVLAALSCVSHDFKQVFEPRLYHNVDVSSIKWGHRLLQAFATDPSRASQVHRLTFVRNRPAIGASASNTPASDGELVGHLTNLRFLSIDSWRSRQHIWKRIQKLTITEALSPDGPLQLLEELSLTGLTRSEPIWPEAIMRLPRLKALSFHLCRLGSKRSTGALIKVPPDLPPLQYLSFSNFDVDPATLKALLHARSCVTIRFEEALRVKYSERGEFIASLEELVVEVHDATSAGRHRNQLKHFVHTDTKERGNLQFSLGEFESVVYLEIGARNLYGSREQLLEGQDQDSLLLALREMLPPAVQVLSLDIPNTDSDWNVFDKFVGLIAQHKEVIAPHIRMIVWQRKDSPHMDVLSEDTLLACEVSGIEVSAAPFARLYLDGQGRLMGLSDRMQARNEE